MTNTPIKFDELPLLLDGTLQDDDILAIQDVSEGETKRIGVEDLRNALLTEDLFVTRAVDIVGALNEYLLSGDNVTQLNSSKLGNLPPAYYLNYENLTNTPTITLRLDEMVNNTINEGGYTSVLNNTLVVRPVVRNADDEVVRSQSGVPISTAFIPEDPSNKYFTNARVDERVAQIFPDEFNKISPTFDRAFSVDSLHDTVGEFVAGTLSDGSILDISAKASNRIFVDDPAELLVNSYRVGDRLRVYGAGVAQNSTIDDAPTDSNVLISAQGFATSAADGSTSQATGKTIEYKFAFFNLTTGEISPASAEFPIPIYVPQETVTDFEGSDISVFDIFNAENFITISLTNIPEGFGVLVYRNADNGEENEGEHRLISVLGPKEIERSGFIDYYNFDYCPWSERRESDNAFLVNGELRNSSDASTVVEKDGLMHFPILAQPSSQRGWVNTSVAAIETVTSGTRRGFNIVLDRIVNFNSSGAYQRDCTVSHNDTSLISGIITSASVGAVKSINLNAKQYIIDTLSVPDNFGLVGVPYITKLKKLPWSGYETPMGSQNSMLVSANDRGRSISVSGLDIDGTSNLQFFMSEPSDNPKSNYMINWGIQSEGCLFNNVRIDRPVGGGIYARQPIDLKITSSELTNSGNTDRYEYSPFIGDQGQNTVITANRFNNFTQFIDVSITDKGIISNNIIANIGSGLLVYGSKFMITNPNTLVGPAGEFLPTPDILNAEYEAINLELNEAYINSIAGLDGTFYGPALTYQENGELYDLDPEDATYKALEYRAYMIEKTPEGSESVWTFAGDNPDTDDTTGDPLPKIEFAIKAGANRKRGEFGFNIPESSVKKIKGYYPSNLNNNDGVYSYKHLSGHLYTTYSGDGTNPYFDGYPATGSGDTETKTHVGLAWSATFTRDIDIGIIKAVKTWESVEGGGNYIDVSEGDVVEHETGASDIYQVHVDISDLDLAVFSIGSKALLDGHGVQVNGGTTNNIAEILNIVVVSESDNTYAVDLRYEGATSIQAGNANLPGTLNILNTFTLAQGRIL